jgi:predicted NACHT family NTPase
MVSSSVGLPKDDLGFQSLPGTWDWFPWKKNKKYGQTLSTTSNINSKEDFNSQAPKASLFKKSWAICDEALLHYADNTICEYYLKKNASRLQIERLSGKILPMDQCYINLALLEDSEESDSNKPPVTSSSRSSDDIVPEEKQVDLSTIFTLTRSSSKDKAIPPPSRIFIQGQAGVGKTTLCKKVIFDFLHNNVWRDRFERVIWIPLRTLVQRNHLNLQKWLEEEFSDNDNDWGVFAKCSFEANISHHGRTLFILDGLDELSDFELNQNLLQTPFEQPHVIITSRHNVSRSSFARFSETDMKLHTIGFYPSQVQKYIEEVEPEHSAEIKSYVQNYSRFQELFRISIQLEILCYIWTVGYSDRFQVPKTMTALYKSIELKLNRKDFTQLRNSKVQVDKYLDAQITSIMKPRMAFLQRLAFTGLINEVIVFSRQNLDKFFDQESDILQEIPQDTGVFEILANASFLSSPNTAAKQKNRYYNFLHLTFQEFFAARYFVEHWKSRKTLSCIDFEHETL